jgi:hypothetical protein
MDMQDKEFDELFHSKLDDFETEPSPAVWEGVDRELNSGKQGKMLLPLLSAAASIIVLVAAGILFIPQKVAVNNHSQKQNPVAKTTPHNSNAQQVANNVIKADVIKSKNITSHVVGAATVNRIALVHQTKTSNPNKNIGTVIDAAKPVKTDEQPVLAATSQKQQDIVKSEVPDQPTQLSIKEPVEESPAFSTRPVLASVQLPAEGKREASPAKRKRGIRSFGDLINVMVAKVDKRKDKFIEFTDTDEDESTITAVNIGILKIKKDK